MERDGEFERVVQEASAGHGDAVDTLLASYLPRLQSFMRVRGGALLDRESAVDLVQSVCRDVLENRERFRHDGEAGFRRWLFKTAYRKIADRHEFWGAQKRDPAGVAALDDRDAREALEVYGAFCSPSRDAIAREQVARIEQAIFDLPEEQRDVLSLAKIVGMSRSEIARELGKTEGAVRMLLHRALARLADVLAAE